MLDAYFFLREQCCNTDSVTFVEVFSFDLGSVKLRRAELLVLTRLPAMGMKKVFWIVHTRKGNGIEAH